MRKIIILGPESTGKSTLSEQLAAHFGTAWCPEYAREYLEKSGNQYDYNDLLEIARGQLALEEEIEKRAVNGLYFIDTGLHVMKVWCEVAFGNCHTWILKQIARHRYDMMLLCDTDLEWQPDPLREYPDLAFRKKLFRIYLDICINQDREWHIVSGSGPERLQNSIRLVEKAFR